MTKEFKFITLSRSFAAFAFDLSNMFGIIYFYTKFNNSVYIAISAYIILHLLYGFLVLISPIIITKLHIKKSLIIASIFFTVSFIPLINLESTPHFKYILIWIILTVIAKSLYHVSFDYYLAKNTSSKGRGNQVSILLISLIFVKILSPILGGEITNAFGFVGLIMMMGVAFLASFIPLFYMKDTYFNNSFNLKYFLSQKPAKQLIKYNFINEFQARGVAFWYIYLFIFFSDSLEGFGVVFSATRLISIMLLIMIGKLLDTHNRKTVLHLNSILLSLGWILRAIANIPIFIIIADVIYKLSKQIKDETITVLNLDQVTHTHHIESVDEYISIKEASINIASGLALGSMLLIFHIFSFKGVFIFTGLTSLLLGLI